MKKLLILAVLGLSLATCPTFGADAPAGKTPTTKVVKITAKTKTIAEKGRFHVLHEQKQKLDCNDCHGGGEKDILFLRFGEFQGKDGPVDRKGCLTCHQAPDKPTFYGVAQ